MNKTRLDRLEETLIKKIVRNFYDYAADTLYSQNGKLEAQLEEINGPNRRRIEAIELYNRLSIEELREYDPDSPKIREYDDKAKKDGK